MFKKEKCKKCGSKVSDKYDFCPHCGNKTSDSGNENWGMLGKNDFLSANEFRLPAGFNALFNSLIKNLSRDLDRQLTENHFGAKPKKIRGDGVSISISTFGGNSPKIKVMPMGEKADIEKDKAKDKIRLKSFTKEEAEAFSNLPREEPKTNIRRLSNKVIYEIEMPEVKQIDDISIIRLENSIEIKAIGRKKSYSKIIPINLPIKNYGFSKGRLVLELGMKNNQQSF
jgi:hypothetical protein